MSGILLEAGLKPEKDVSLSQMIYSAVSPTGCPLSGIRVLFHLSTFNLSLEFPLFRVLPVLFLLWIRRYYLNSRFNKSLLVELDAMTFLFDYVLLA